MKRTLLAKCSKDHKVTHSRSQSEKNVQGDQNRDVATIPYCFGNLQYICSFFFTYFHGTVLFKLYCFSVKGLMSMHLNMQNS